MQAVHVHFNGTKLAWRSDAEASALSLSSLNATAVTVILTLMHFTFPGLQCQSVCVVVRVTNRRQFVIRKEPLWNEVAFLPFGSAVSVFPETVGIRLV